MEKTSRIAILGLFVSFLTVSVASADFPSELKSGDRIDLTTLDSSESRWMINYPGLNGQNGCLAVDYGTEPFDVAFFVSQIRAYAGARLLFGSYEYSVYPLDVAATESGSIVIPLRGCDAYQTGVVLRTNEVGESFQSLVRRSSRGRNAAGVSFRLVDCS